MKNFLEPSAEQPTVRIRLFGELRLTASQGEEITVESRRGQAMLGFLAIDRDHAASRERLSGLLWSDKSENQARNSLRQCLFQVRKDLGRDCSLVIPDRHGVRMARDKFSTDLDEVVACMTKPDDRNIAEGLERMGVDLLLASLAIGDLYDEWIRSVRTGVDDLVERAVKEKIAELSNRQEWNSVRRLADLYLRRHPSSEEIVAAALRADAAVNAFVAAHRRFKTYSQYLRNELGVSPSVELNKLVERLNPALWSSKPITRATSSVEDLSSRTDLDPPLIVVTSLAKSTSLSATGCELAQLICDELLSGLAKFSDLRVLHVDVFGELHLEALKRTPIEAYILGGTVRQITHELIVLLRLTTLDGVVVWSKRFAVDANDPAGGLRALVGESVAAVEPTIDRSLFRDINGSLPANAPTLLTYVRGRLLARRASTLEEARRAAELLERTIDDDPTVTGAYLHLARLYNTDYLHNVAGHDHHELRLRAFELCRTALELDPRNSHAHTQFGWTCLRRSYWEAARSHFDTAVDLNPFNPDRLDEAAAGYGYLGDLGRAHELVQLAISLNPFPHREYLADAAVINVLSLRHVAAAHQFEASTDTAPTYLAFRLINLALLDSKADIVAQKASELRKSIASIWVRAAAPTDQEIIAWLRMHTPLRREREQTLWRAGLRLAGLRFAS